MTSSVSRVRIETIWREILNTPLISQVPLPSADSSGNRNFAWDARRLPTGGHYLPVFLDLIADLESGEGISPETHVLVETTTGNAGTAIGFLAKALGYPLVLFMPEDMPAARKEKVASYLPNDGISCIHFTPAGQYVKGMVRELRSFLVDHKHGFMGRKIVSLNHSRRASAPNSIKKSVVAALQLAGIHEIHFAIAAIGNGTASAGLFSAARAISADAKCIGVEPVEAPASYIRKYGEDSYRTLTGHGPDFHSHGLIGSGGWGVSFPLIDIEEMDQISLVGERDWKPEESRLKQAGFNVGHTSCACQYVAGRLAKTTHNSTILSIIYDDGNAY